MDYSGATVVRVKTLHISSLILAAKSPFFYKLFSNGMSESEQRQITLRINASEEAGLMELLKFMYSNTLNISATPALLDVLMAADKFDVPSCMKYLLNPPMTLDSALLYLELPYTVVAAQPLIDAAKHYLVDRYKDMYNKQVKEERLALPLSGIEAILASDDLVVESEEDVYTFTLNWARQKYKSLKERQEVLGTRLARLIRFPYMTCEKLKIVLTCNDFEHEGASKLVHEALSFKAEAPDRQQTLAAEESISLSRRFVERAYKTTMDMCLTRAECVAMFPSGHVHSKPSRLAGQMFFLSAQCDMDEHDFFHCCSLSLGMKTGYSRSIAVDFQFSVRLRPTVDYFIMCKSNHTFTPGTRSVSRIRNPFKVPWTSFIAEDSLFFINDVLHLRAKLWIAH
ncbi:BTB/POZ domain-containing protein POB1-like isoform X2 [Lotus japonicus]|nr:BTB/POZ domain-containing protein POB1-like isoform X2 [Lotus japonicus]XP_057453450.1 BTB/POZ domain-containing protein POB1-like isoform X2 [Lotus japonicus]